MDKRISPQDLAVLDRRQVLRGAAAATAIRALPASERAVAAPQEIEASANLAGWSHFSQTHFAALRKSRYGIDCERKRGCRYCPS